MTRSSIFLPFHRLPPGLQAADTRHPPVEPLPAATVILLRPGSEGMEVLLLRRPLQSSFAAGAWVFPGGRVDPGDADERTTNRIQGSVSHPAFLAAAVREALEETGLPVALHGQADPVIPAAAHPARSSLLEERSTLAEILEAEDWWIHGNRLALVAHWVTPVGEARRYDTRFFAAGVPTDWEGDVQGGELTEGRWLTPRQALGRNREGGFPMLFPTVHTLEILLPYSHPDGLLADFRHREIPTFAPRLAAQEGGMVIHLWDDDTGGSGARRSPGNA
ncbi:MAG: NUDIX domain-containing protein [Gemmatimonadota bacterium]